MELVAPEPGDIIIQATEYSRVPHTIIWLDLAERCIAEASDGQMSGVRLATRKEFAIAEYADALPYSTVFRCKDAKMAAIAAECARKWAVTSKDENHIHKGVTNGQVIGERGKALVPTPYHMRERQAEKGPWTTTEAIFTMARAFVRDQQNKPLSMNQGMGCAGFVTYCYQVASLKARVGPNLPTEQMKLMEMFVELKNEANVAWIARRNEQEFKQLSDTEFLSNPKRKQEEIFGRATAAKQKAQESFAREPGLVNCLKEIPREILLDAKSTRTEALLKSLQSGETFWSPGFLVGNKSKNFSDKVGIVPAKYAPQKDSEMAEFNKNLLDAKGWV